MTWHVQIQHRNTTGVIAVQTIYCYGKAEARKELAAEVRARRNAKRFYIVKNRKPRSFHAAEYDAPIGCYWTLSIVAARETHPLAEMVRDLGVQS